MMFHKVLAEAGLPHMRFYDLQHSAATILLSMGVNIKVIGPMIKKMGMVRRFIQMETRTKEIGLMVKKQDMANTCIQVEVRIKAIGKITKKMDQVH